MSVQHKTLRDEILFVIGRATIALNSSEIYERCTLADEMKQVSNAIFQLKDAGKIEAAEGDGRKRYKLADGLAAPAPAGKAGRPAEAPAEPAAGDMRAKGREEAAHRRAEPGKPIAGVRPEPGLPVLDIPRLGESLGGAAGKTVRRDAEPPQSPDDDEIAKGLDQVERQVDAEHLADAIIARLKRQLAPTLCEMEAAAGLDRLNVHIHIEQIDFHLGGL